jgi:hypothetical protein
MSTVDSMRSCVDGFDDISMISGAIDMEMDQACLCSRITYCFEFELKESSRAPRVRPPFISSTLKGL